MRQFCKKAMLCLLAAAAAVNSRADERTWLPSLISQRIDDMQAKGFKLDAEDIYSINQASLKDAVVLFGRGCTGEVVSSEGLLLTNHHCGYGKLQKLSSVEHDYLKDGYWAMTRSEELPCEGLTVTFLEYMTDLTPMLEDVEKKTRKAFPGSEDIEEKVTEARDSVIRSEIVWSDLSTAKCILVFIHDIPLAISCGSFPSS